MTSALDGGEWSATRPGRALPPGKGSPVPIGQDAGWATESVWTQRLEEKSSCFCQGSNLDRLVIQPVIRHYEYTDWATSAPMYTIQILFIIPSKVYWYFLSLSTFVFLSLSSYSILYYNIFVSIQPTRVSLTKISSWLAKGQALCDAITLCQVSGVDQVIAVWPLSTDMKGGLSVWLAKVFSCICKKTH
jgi:hypothetical protein